MIVEVGPGAPATEGTGGAALAGILSADFRARVRCSPRTARQGGCEITGVRVMSDSSRKIDADGRVRRRLLTAGRRRADGRLDGR